MKAVAISSTREVRELVEQARAQGYLTFIYHHADPEHALLDDAFLYVYSDEELREKLELLRCDVTAIDLIH
jgi:hypothetical protein